MVEYLKTNPDTKTDDVDEKKESFLKLLEPYGFTKFAPPVQPSPPNTTTNITTIAPSSATPPVSIPVKRKTIKDKPTYTRKKIPAPLEKLVKECYSLDQNNFSNAKIALARVTFECSLKFIVENTIYKGNKNLYESAYFRNVFYDGKGIKRPYTDFTKLKTLFSDLILNTGDRKAFENFDLERMHQIIHNYKVGAVPADAKGLCDNLVPLIEFMLNDEADLMVSLDLSKLP